MLTMATMTRPVTMELAERTDPPQKWKSSLFLLKLTCMIIVIVIIKLTYVIIKLTCMISIVLFISIIVFLIIIIFFVFIIFFVIIVPILTCQGIL